MRGDQLVLFAQEPCHIVNTAVTLRQLGGKSFDMF